MMHTTSPLWTFTLMSRSTSMSSKDFFKWTDSSNTPSVMIISPYLFNNQDFWMRLSTTFCSTIRMERRSR